MEYRPLYAETTSEVGPNTDQEGSEMSEKCGQKLYEAGVLVARCIVERGTEHDHSERTASQAVGAGTAEAVSA